MNGLRAGLVAVTMWFAVADPAAAFDLQGHRGARGLTPENTLDGFKAAIAMGVTTLETDLALTRDGHLVLTHDPLLNPDLVRAGDGRWVEPGIAVRGLTLAEVQRFDVGRLKPGTAYARQWPEQVSQDGARIPTFAAFAAMVKAAGRRVRINIETKLRPDRAYETASAEEFAAAVVTAVRAHGLEDVTTVQSFDWRTLRAIKRLAPDLATACLTIETERANNLRPPPGAPSWTAGLQLDAVGGAVPRLVLAAGCGTWSPFWRNVDADRLKEAKALGLRVVPWTVNAPSDLSAIIGLGVDGVITDYPDRARAVLAAMGRAPE